MDWFLYDSKLRHERVNEVLSSVYASGNNMSLILSQTYCHWKWKGRKHSAAISLMLTGYLIRQIVLARLIIFNNILQNNP